jgi:predicted thioesterase
MEVTAGTSATIERLVDEKNCTTRGEYKIFSTPNLVLLVEETAIKALKPFLKENQACVGSTIDIAHSAPTLLGQTVTAKITVKQVDRRRITFDVKVYDEIDTISTGSHERFIVDIPKLEQRLAEKKEILGQKRAHPL